MGTFQATDCGGRVGNRLQQAQRQLCNRHAILSGEDAMRKSIVILLTVLLVPLLLLASGTTQAKPTNERGIYGTVYFDGEPVRGARVYLTRFDYSSLEWDFLSEFITDQSGFYLFSNVDSLAQDQAYVVGFINGRFHPEYVIFWNGPIIKTYTEGDYVHGGDFDIKNVPLIGPKSGTVAEFPVTFTWGNRGVEGDTYRVVIENAYPYLGIGGWSSPELGNVDSYTISTTPPGLSGECIWSVVIINEPNGRGYPFELHFDITFPWVDYLPAVIGST